MLVLDDAHELRDVAALHFIRALAVSVPPGFHVAVGSRVGLGLGAPRREVRWVEFGPDDLAFSDDEARLVLAGAGVVCSKQEVAALVRRTHGWPAAVHLSALASGAAPGEEMRVQLRAAGWDGQGRRAVAAAVHAIGNQHRAVARLSAPLSGVGSNPTIIGRPTLTRAEMHVLG